MPFLYKSVIYTEVDIFEVVMIANNTMNTTYETIFERIEADPLIHLGGYSPTLIHAYFDGYDHSCYKHAHSNPGGRMRRRQFTDWFSNKIHSGPQDCARVCLLNTDTEEEALALFFEFRKMAFKEFTEDQTDDSAREDPDASLSLTEVVLNEVMRTKPVLYFGNEDWLRGMWAYCSGYLWAENDFGIDSEDRKTFTDFQKWLDKRYPFAEGRNWGKLFTFLGLGSNQQAHEQFYDVFALFLEGGDPDGPTKRCSNWIAACLEDLNERKAKGEL